MRARTLALSQMAIVVCFWFGLVQPVCAASAWIQAGHAESAIQEDTRDCTDEARLVGVTVGLRGARSAGAGAQLIGGIAGGGFSALLTPKARAEYVESCMEGRGYRAADASADQQSKSVDDLLRPTLPQIQSESLTYGPVRFDPNMLSVTRGVISESGTVLVGKVSYRKVAVVRSDVVIFPTIHVDHGSLAYALVSDAPDGSKTYWCGQTKSGIFGATTSYCVWEDQRGCVFENLITPSEMRNIPNPDYPPTAKAAPSSFALDEAPTKITSSVDFSMTVEKIGLGGVSLTAKAILAGQKEAFWSGDILFDEHGKAVLNFWTHRLILTRSGDGVVATLVADGDGEGWETAPYKRVY